MAEEALMLAVSAVNCTDNYLDAVRYATIISGDSDTVGAIAGGLAAARGNQPPDSLVAKLDVLASITKLLSRVQLSST